MLIVFIGPDGCGKTTVATAVAKRLRERSVCVRFFELNFGILPRFRDIAGFLLRRPVGQSHAPGEYLAGMKQASNTPAKGAVYMLWYGFDYFLGRLRYRSFLKCEAVIFARYVYDYGYQRAYARVPRPFLSLMLRLAPTPDHVFTIDRVSERIFEGKPELTVEEIRRQQQCIVRLLAGKSYFHILDGNRGVEDTVARALAIIEGAGKS